MTANPKVRKIAWVVLGVVVAVLAVGGAVVLWTPHPGDRSESPSQYEELKKRIDYARGLYDEAMSLRDDEDQEKFRSKLEEAKDHIGSLLSEFDTVLDEHK